MFVSLILGSYSANFKKCGAYDLELLIIENIIYIYIYLLILISHVHGFTITFD